MIARPGNQEYGRSAEWASSAAMSTDALEGAALEFMETVEAVRGSYENPLAQDFHRLWSVNCSTIHDDDGDQSLMPLDVLGAASVNASLATLSGTKTSPELFAAYVTAAAGVAIAELENATVAEFLRAYTLGRIVGASVQASLGSLEGEAGWCAGAAAARIAAAVCAADLLHLDGPQIQAAVGLAATQASGLSVQSGARIMAWRLGCATRDGLLAALLAATPWVGPIHPLDGPRGLYRLYGVPSNRDGFAGNVIAPDQIAALFDTDINKVLETARLPFAPSATVVDLTPHFVRVSAATDISNSAHEGLRATKVTRVY